MSRTYELWDAGTSNLVGSHASEADALAFVRRYVSQHGPAYPSSWVLLWDDDGADEAGEIAEGQSLLALAGIAIGDDQVMQTVNRRAG